MTPRCSGRPGRWSSRPGRPPLPPVLGDVVRDRYIKEGLLPSEGGSGEGFQGPFGVVQGALPALGVRTGGEPLLAPAGSAEPFPRAVQHGPDHPPVLAVGGPVDGRRSDTDLLRLLIAGLKEETIARQLGSASAQCGGASGACKGMGGSDEDAARVQARGPAPGRGGDGSRGRRLSHSGA